MLLSVFIIIALIALAIASYTDIKTLEVPDWLSYSLIAIGLIGNLLFSIYYSDSIYIIRSLLGLVISVILGLIMFYTGQWGGGDSKVLFGIGAIIGINYPFTIDFLFTDFFFKFIINMLFAGAVYGIIWITVMAVKNRKFLFKTLKKSFQDNKFKRIRLITGLISIIFLASIYFLPFLDSKSKIISSILVIILYFMNYLFVFVRAVEKVSMIKMIDPEKLTEGDWIVDEIKINGKYIAGPKDLGIEKSKIQELIKYKKQGKIKKVKVKYGIPFVPSFLISMIYTTISDSIILLHFI